MGAAILDCCFVMLGGRAEEDIRENMYRASEDNGREHEQGTEMLLTIKQQGSQSLACRLYF